MARHPYGLGALLALALAVSQDASAQGLFDNLKGALTGEKKQEATHLEQMKAKGATRPTCGGDGRASRLNASVEQGLGVVQENEISAYLQGIATRLLQNSPYPDCRVTVYVTPHDAAQAVALADGGILIAIGFLRNLKSEDEVAALLGHELSHILLDHHSSDALVESQDGFLKGLETANATGGMVLGMIDPNLQQGVSATLSVGDAVYNISESMIAPAWTSGQEDEADLLGTDLLTAAGYNPRAMASIMDVIEAQEANAAEVDAAREKIYQERVQGKVLETVTSTDINNPLSIVSSIAGLTSAVVSGTDKKTHRPAAERKDSINAYIKDFHNEHRRRVFAAEPWEAALKGGQSGQMFSQYTAASKARRAVLTGGDLEAAEQDARVGVAGAFSEDAYPRLALSEVRIGQSRRDDALENLEIAMRGGNAPWQIYRSYADLQLATGNVAAAARTVEEADQRFARPLGIAPYAIKVFRAANDQQKVAYYLKRCEESGSRAHLQICQNAAGVAPQQETAPASGLGNFFGSFKPR